MPELPEVETVCRDLSDYLCGLTLDEADIYGKRTIRRSTWTDKDIVHAIQGLQLAKVARYGKFILFYFEDYLTKSNPYLVVHLGMSGRFMYKSAVVSSGIDHSKLYLRFGDRELVLWDPRTFGEVFMEKHLEADGRPSTVSSVLGVDPILYREKVPLALKMAADRSKRPIKSVLLDQRVIAGLGNIYSDEVLFRCGLRPNRSIASLNGTEIEILAEGINEVLTEAIEMRGSSLNDLSYLDLAGLPGTYQRKHLIYGRYGKPCSRCGSIVERVLLSGRYSSYCRDCQR